MEVTLECLHSKALLTKDLWCDKTHERSAQNIYFTKKTNARSEWVLAQRCEFSRQLSRHRECPVMGFDAALRS
ncbi:MAG: hypothetical protein K5985_06730, partial [Lachnospiraceae bacterium]|nr:hypothetical protein [Lachnospiraceae bacterium]